MNPYLSAGLAMCAVLFVALAGTAYLAVFFNKRAKADMQKSLDPLAAVIEGAVDIDEAQITGTYDGTIAQARVTGAEGGAGRVFQTEIIDAAGGVRWRYRSIAHRDNPVPTSEFDSDQQQLRVEFDKEFAIDLLSGFSDPTKHWLWVEYSPDSGVVRLTLPMQTRRDIPDAEAFKRQLAYLRDLGNRNRVLQEKS
ncbi:MAG: hypothetical protein ACR2OU_13615 [Thermomicrobiales bacterium]